MREDAERSALNDKQGEDGRAANMIWYDMIWYDMIWYDMIWYDMIWYDMIWYDMIWYAVEARYNEVPRDRKNSVLCYIGVSL